MSRRNIPPEWSELLNGMADATLTDPQEQRLTELLQSDPEFRQEYLRFIQMLTALTWQSPAAPLIETSAPDSSAAGDPPVSSSRPVPPVRSARTFRPVQSALPGFTRLRQLVVALVLLVVVLAGFWWMPGDSVVQDPQMGALTEVFGSVEILRQAGEEFRVLAADIQRQPWPLLMGDQVRVGRDGSAVIRFSEGTEVSLYRETQLTLTQAAGLTLLLEAGQVAARVRPQPPDQPFVLRLPLAVVEVLGTELEVFSSGMQSRLAVTTGRVRVTRTADGKTAEVAASQYLSVSESGALNVVDIAPAPDEWSPDFQDGLPPGWTGRHITAGLPAQTRGAVLPVPVSSPEGGRQELSSSITETGLFAWHADSRLHLSYQVQPPGWFHLYVIAHPAGAPDVWVTLSCVKPELWQSSAGQWQTASIPLSEFQPVTRDWSGPALGLIPVQIVVRSRTDSMDVAIDHIRVDRRREVESR